jgi:hypothetical protein
MLANHTLRTWAVEVMSLIFFSTMYSIPLNFITLHFLKSVCTTRFVKNIY